jgi:hypothetical protein
MAGSIEKKFGSELKTNSEEGIIKFPPRLDDKIANQKVEKLDVDYILTNVEYLRNWSMFKETLMSLARLAVELENQLADYDTIISDEASGRLVSLFFRELINKKRQKLNRNQVQTYFIKGGFFNEGKTSRKVKESIREFLAKKKPQIKRALLVTEYIQTGEKVVPLVEAVESSGIDFDVAAVSVDEVFFSEVKRSPEFYQPLANRLRYGGKNSHGLFFWNKTFTGVEKDIKDESIHPRRHPSASQEVINQSRRDIKLIAGEIEKIID